LGRETVHRNPCFILAAGAIDKAGFVKNRTQAAATENSLEFVSEGQIHSLLRF